MTFNVPNAATFPVALSTVNAPDPTLTLPNTPKVEFNAVAPTTFNDDIKLVAELTSNVPATVVFPVDELTVNLFVAIAKLPPALNVPAIEVLPELATIKTLLLLTDTVPVTFRLPEIFAVLCNVSSPPMVVFPLAEATVNLFAPMAKSPARFKLFCRLARPVICVAPVTFNVP